MSSRKVPQVNKKKEWKWINKIWVFLVKNKKLNNWQSVWHDNKSSCALACICHPRTGQRTVNAISLLRRNGTSRTSGLERRTWTIEIRAGMEKVCSNRCKIVRPRAQCIAKAQPHPHSWNVFILTIQGRYPYHLQDLCLGCRIILLPYLHGKYKYDSCGNGLNFPYTSCSRLPQAK